MTNTDIDTYLFAYNNAIMSGMTHEEIMSALRLGYDLDDCADNRRYMEWLESTSNEKGGIQ